MLVLAGLMSVAGNDRIEAGGSWFEVQFAEIVEHVKTGTGGLDDGGQRELQRPTLSIDIAADGKDGGDGFQLGENFRRANIAGMDDEMDATQGEQGLGAKKPVGIGNDTKTHGRGKNSVLVAIFLGDVILGDFVSNHFGDIGVRGVLDAGDDFRLEGLSLFEEFRDAFGVNIG